ncbi:MAG: VWA domain-containing protein [Trueperaceae bacterium]|nr:MAG: VWA domain-containing protein [Trueperaceae bacterium]
MEVLSQLFAAPWVLLALLALPLLPLGQRRVWRGLTLALLVIALAQPQLPRDQDRTVLVVDVSDSVRAGALEATREFALETWGDETTTLYFAADTVRVPGPTADVPSVLNRGATDIARALQVASADAPARIVLVSDGVASRGDVSAALPTVPVDVLHVDPAPNARLSTLLVPDRAPPGATLEAVAVVELDRAAELTLRPSVDGAALPGTTHALQPGRHALPFEVVAGAAGVLRVEATIEVDFDQPTADDRQAAEVVVSQDAPVLVIGDAATAALLRAQGIDVVEGGPEIVQTPLDYGAIVVRGGVDDFSSGQLELLARYVEQGGGLLKTGGPDGFGLGGWYRTPLDAVLPVASDVRTDVTLPQVAMVIVLDISMSMVAGNPSRLEIAKRGALDVVDLAYQDDLVGLIVFSDPALTRWAFELRPATDRGKLEMRDAILSIEAQGGTILLPGYRMALEALRDVDAAIKHVIVLSDGFLFDGTGPFGGGTPPDWFEVGREGRRDGITTSTIAIGEADPEQLSAIARGGGGRFYEAADPGTLPRIFTNEALTATRDLLRAEPTVPTARRHPLFPVDGALPSVDAYVSTTLRPEAEALMVGVDAEPVLAVGRHGLGRSAALTTDLNAWAGALGRWTDLPGVLGGVVRWLQARPDQYTVTTNRSGARLEVVVDAVRDGAYVNDARLTARFQGQQVALQQVAPGRYAAHLDVSGSGGTMVIADAQDVVARRQVATPDPEFAPIDGSAVLADLAARTGGTVIGDPAAYRPPATQQWSPVWVWPAVAALALFLVELLWRRLGREGAVTTRRDPVFSRLRLRRAERPPPLS